MNQYEQYDVFEKGDSRRLIKEICLYGDPQVIYALYRKDRKWSNQNGHYIEWLYLREGYCRIDTFERWLKGAKKVVGVG